MTRIIRLRKECPEIGWGQWKILPTRTPSVLAIAYQLEGSTLVCVHNFDGVATEISLRLDVDASSLTNLMLDEDIYPDARGRYGITLEAFGYGWCRAGPAREALRP